MNTATKIWLAIATILVVIGGLVFASVMITFKWDFTKLSTNKCEAVSHKISEDFNSISIQADTTHITFASAEDAQCSVVCYEYKNAPHSLEVADDTLIIKNIDARKWYEHIGFNFSTPKITVYLPKTAYSGLIIQNSTGDLQIPQDFKFESVDILLSTGDVRFFASAEELIKIRTSTGSIRLENTAAGALTLSTSTGGITISNVVCTGDADFSVSTGKMKLKDFACKNLKSAGDTGDLSLNKVIAAEKMTVKRSTGDITFEASDAAELLIETDTGDVRGSLLTDKIFFARSETGKVDTPKTISGGKCEITTSTGDIKMRIEK